MFGKLNTTTKEKFSREDLQLHLEAVLGQVLHDLGAPIATLDAAHGRRTVRAMIRIGARVARSLGCDLRTFLALAAVCFENESKVTPWAEA